MRLAHLTLCAAVTLAVAGCSCTSESCPSTCPEGLSRLVDLTVDVSSDGPLTGVALTAQTGEEGACEARADGSWRCRATVAGQAGEVSSGTSISVSAAGHAPRSVVVLGCCEQSPQSFSVEFAASPDAGSSDAGSSDAGSSDAGSSDAGSSDAGSSDAGDAGPAPDAGTQVVTALPGGSVSGAGGCRAAQPAPLGLTRTTVTTHEVNVPQQSPHCVDLAVTEPSASATFRGTLVFSSGNGGGSWWSDDAVDGGGAAALMALADEGYRVVQRGWQGGWMRSDASGMAPGFAARSARYAQLVAHLEDTLPAGGPLCVTGQSGGALEISLAATHWGLGGLVDLVVPTAGPSLDTATLCYSDPSTYAGAATCQSWASRLPTPECEGGPWVCGDPDQFGRFVDLAHDDLPAGTCESSTPSAAELQQLADDSVLSPLAQRHFERTAWRTITGAGECGMLTSGAAELAEALGEAGTDATFTRAPGRHGVPNTAAGVAVILDAIRTGCVERH